MNNAGECGIEGHDESQIQGDISSQGQVRPGE